MARKVIAASGGSVRGKKIAVLGLTFKPNTDDLRDAPALTIIQALQDNGARIAVYDPEGISGAKTFLQDVAFGCDPYAIAADAEALVLVTEWDAFRALDFRRLRTMMKTPVLVDLRNVYRPDDVARHGFRLGGLRSFEHEVTPATIAAVRERAAHSLKTWSPAR